MFESNKDLKENPDVMSPFIRPEMEQGLAEKLDVLFSPENINLKTDIPNPLALAGLEVLAEACEEVGMIKTHDRIMSIINKRNINYVSYKRESRTEYLEGLKSLGGGYREPDMSVSMRDRLLKDLNEV